MPKSPVAYILGLEMMLHAPLCVLRLVFGVALPWVDERRYLGVFIPQLRTFKCSLDHARKSFYRSANYVFGKVRRIASEEVVLQLIRSLVNAFLLYFTAWKTSLLTKANLSTTDFVVNRFFVKLFRTNNI